MNNLNQHPCGLVCMASRKYASVYSCEVTIPCLHLSRYSPHAEVEIFTFPCLAVVLPVIGDKMNTVIVEYDYGGFYACLHDFWVR